jgi:hypothetical protein
LSSAGPEERFVSEPIVPEPGSFSTEGMARGLASMPGAFTWRGRRYRVVEQLEEHKVSGPEGGRADGERYLRRQVFRVRLDSGEVATIYVLRDSRVGKRRWFLYSLASE